MLLRISRAVNSDEDDRKEVDIVNRHAKAVLLATSRATDNSLWANDFPALTSASEAILEAKSILNATKDTRKEAKDSLDNLHKKINRIFGSAKRGDVGRAQKRVSFSRQSSQSLRRKRSYKAQ